MKKPKEPTNIRISEWICYKCREKRMIKTDDLILLQLGDRMASTIFYYCDSEKCKNKLSAQLPVNKDAKKIFDNRLFSLQLKGTTDDYPKFKKEKL